MSADDVLPMNDSNTNRLFASSAIAGPLFTVVWLILGANRADYNPLRHPISSLSIGEFGWTQATNFIVTGLLMLAFAVGLRRKLNSPEGSVWGPRLIGLMAMGFLGAGIFVTDPLNGYPPGTPDLSFEISVPGRLHRLFSAFVFIGLPIACFVFARLFRRWGESKWAIYSVVTGVAFIIMFVVTSAGFAQVAGLVDYAGLLQRITLIIGWAWITLLAIHMLKVPTELLTR